MMSKEHIFQNFICKPQNLLMSLISLIRPLFFFLFVKRIKLKNSVRADIFYPPPHSFFWKMFVHTLYLEILINSHTYIVNKLFDLVFSVGNSGCTILVYGKVVLNRIF